MTKVVAVFRKHIKNKFIAGFIVIFALFAILIAISLNNLTYFKNLIDDFYVHPFAVTNTCRSLQLRFNDLHYLERNIIFQNERTKTAEIEEKILEHKKNIDPYFEVLRSQYLGQESDIDSLETAYQNWQKYWDQGIFNRKKTLNPEKIEEITIHELELFENANSQIAKILRFALHKANSYIFTSNAEIKEKYKLDLTILIISLLILLVILILFFIRVYKRLLEILEVVIKISAGNYEERCKVGSFDEIGMFSVSVNEMTDQLVGFNHKLEEEVKARTAELEAEMENLARVKTELEQKNRLAVSIFNSEFFGITMWDEAGRLLQVNDNFCSITGYTQEDIKSEIIDWKTLTPEEHYETELAFHKKLIEEKKALPCEKEMKLKNGNKTTVLIAKEVISEDPFRGISFVLDISKRKAVEVELEEFRENLQEKVNERTRELEDTMKLMQSSRNSLSYLLEDVNDSRNNVIKVNEQLDLLNKELEAFSYPVSHDLKAPLRAIDGFSSALKEDYFDKLDDDGKEFIDLIRNNAQKMGALINDLLEFSRLGRKDINFTEVSMQELVDDVYGDMIGLEKDRKIELKTDNLCTVFADRTMIKQVVINLVSNALKFTRMEPVTKIEIGCVDSEDGKYVEFYVRDNGVGFDMKYYDKLFGVFQRLHTDETFEGTGVGLALIKRIISKHKGTVWAEGKSDEGATFRFTLPKRDKIVNTENTLQND
ncbi:MAG: ATP-binding protein [Candidatus Stygibacter frigidus]|nr:ATP-binding protein [Candidatus Stygibacter frigidus]